MSTARTVLPLYPKHPERTCWGCDKYCPADALACANGTIRTLHPIELFGDDWLEWFESRMTERAKRSEPRERSEPAKRRASERVGESEGQSPSE